MRSLFLSGVCLILMCSVLSAQAPELAWGLQFGTAVADFPRGVCSDTDGNVYVVGSTRGDLGGTNAGGEDGFLIKADRMGQVIWTRQLGSSGSEDLSGVTVDENQDIIVAGRTSKQVGAEKFGSSDVIVSKFNGAGEQQWLFQFGTSKADYANRLVTDKENKIYVIGKTTGIMADSSAGANDIFIMKLDPDGTRLWTRQFGSAGNEDGLDLAVHSSGDIYFTGTTTGSFDIAALGNEDIITGRLDADGNILWIRQTGTTLQDQGKGLAVDAVGNVYTGGWSYGVIGARAFGGGDAVLLYYDKDGALQWKIQFGTGNWDGAHGMAITSDGSGDALVSGCWTWPGCNGWVRRYDNQGALIWEKLIYNNKAKSSCGQTVFMDDNGNVYHIGGTDDNLFRNSYGDQDAFLVKLGSTSRIDQNGLQPGNFELYQNSPNPFNPETGIRYSLSQHADIRLEITSVTGKTVTTLVDGWQTAGSYQVRWDGTDAGGAEMASGLYFCRLHDGGNMMMKKMLLVR